jgi:hypothetical protein
MHLSHILFAATVSAFSSLVTAQTIPGTGIDVENYATEVTPNLSDKSINVTAEIRFKSTQDGLA